MYQNKNHVPFKNVLHYTQYPHINYLNPNLQYFEIRITSTYLFTYTNNHKKHLRKPPKVKTRENRKALLSYHSDEDNSVRSQVPTRAGPPLENQ